MRDSIRIPADVARKLGYYVYLYVNPIDGCIFYVGKGDELEGSFAGAETDGPLRFEQNHGMSRKVGARPEIQTAVGDGRIRARAPERRYESGRIVKCRDATLDATPNRQTDVSLVWEHFGDERANPSASSSAVS